MAFPQTNDVARTPEILSLVKRLLPLLLQGDHPSFPILREQMAQAQIGAVELTGVGFFAELKIPSDAPKVDPPNIAGGSAVIELTGTNHGAGCVLFVRDGYLATLEGFTYGDDKWSEHAVVLSVTDVFPIQP